MPWLLTQERCFALAVCPLHVSPGSPACSRHPAVHHARPALRHCSASGGKAVTEQGDKQSEAGAA